ncbi:MAG: YggT family protein [Anaerolineae bacterium]|nr:YggT family protein [Anaerolineae bacterium]
MTTLVIAWLIRIVNWLFGALSLALLLRMLLPWFGMGAHHPIMRFVAALTEPVVKPAQRMLGGRVIWTGQGSLDIAPLVAFFVLWMAQTLLVRALAWIAAPPVWVLYPGRDFGSWLTGLIGLLFQLYSFILLARILLEWLRVSLRNPVVRFIWQITDPLLAATRRFVPIIGGLDFSPVVALLFLSLVQMLLNVLIQSLF